RCPFCVATTGGTDRGDSGLLSSSSLGSSLGRCRLVCQLFLDPRGLARTLTQVVELGAANVAAALHFNRCDQRRVQLERTFHAFTRRNLAHDERRIQAAI